MPCIGFSVCSCIGHAYTYSIYHLVNAIQQQRLIFVIERIQLFIEINKIIIVGLVYISYIYSFMHI